MPPILRTLIPAFALVLATPALAQTTPPTPQPTQPPRVFIAADTDHDGKLSFDEFKALVQRLEARRAAKHPDAASRVAKLTPDQLDARLHKRFDRIDADHDGFIETAEWQQMRARAQAAKAQRQGLPAQTESAPPPNP